jgi:FkbM family methyltransferase
VVLPFSVWTHRKLDIAIQKTRFRGFQLFYRHQESADSMCRECDVFPSFFTPDGERPLIIDAGSNIGVSVLEWKTRWPQCELICFEPDPFAFELLKQNVEHNGLPSVTYHNVALSDHEGTASFHGAIGQDADARGNSLLQDWGKRHDSRTVQVPCKRLSSFIGTREVSFLKLDVEGSEERVLRDIKNQLLQIAAMYVEVHETASSLEENSAERIIAQLSAAGFTIEPATRHSPHALPPHLQQWSKRVGARQTQLMCWRD